MFIDRERSILVVFPVEGIVMAVFINRDLAPEPVVTGLLKASRAP